MLFKTVSWGWIRVAITFFLTDHCNSYHVTCQKCSLSRCHTFVSQLQPIGTLSEGQKARVLFAWMAYKTPHILLLDEPTNALDMETIDSLAEVCELRKQLFWSHVFFSLGNTCVHTHCPGNDRQSQQLCRAPFLHMEGLPASAFSLSLWGCGGLLKQSWD